MTEQNTKVDVERLALALHNVTVERGYIDLGGMDLAFGGGGPFRDVASDLATEYDRLADEDRDAS